MRVLLAATPGGGHVLPLIPIFNALRSAGHDTAIAISDEVFVPGLDDSAQRYSKDPSRFPLCPHQRGPKRREWWWRVNTEMAWASYLSTIRIIEEFKPDLLIRDAAERGAYLAAEVAEINHVTVLAGSETTLAPYLDREREISAPWRASLGLPNDIDGSTQVPLLGISLTHPIFFGSQADFIPSARFYKAEKLNLKFDAGRRSPSILITMGSSLAIPHVDFARKILEGLRGYDARVTLAVPDCFKSTLSNDFTFANILGFSDLSPHFNNADIVVSHGGFGTVQAALNRGVPMHITPFSSDQFFNAERISECGVGVSLSWELCTPQRLARSVLDVAYDSSFRNAAQHFAKEVQSLPGMEECVSDMFSLL